MQYSKPPLLAVVIYAVRVAATGSGATPQWNEGVYNTSPEFGLFWAIQSDYRGRSYATEAAHAFLGVLFKALSARQFVATTEFENPASTAVMRQLGMTIRDNPDKQPRWFERVGVITHTEWDARLGR